MRFIIPLAVMAGLGASSFALAQAATREFKADAQQGTISIADLTAQIDRLGYDVRRLKAEERHYEALIVDRASGGAVEATYDKASGELLGAQLAERPHQADERDEAEGHRARRHHAGRESERTNMKSSGGADADSDAHNRRSGKD